MGHTFNFYTHSGSVRVGRSKRKLQVGKDGGEWELLLLLLRSLCVEIFPRFPKWPIAKASVLFVNQGQN